MGERDFLGSKTNIHEAEEIFRHFLFRLQIK